MDVDLVYLWVDGGDPQWIKKKQQITHTPASHAEVYNAARFVNNEELKYSLRSAEKYVPWIRQIFIVTDNQTPDWLNISHPKIRLVDHTHIMPPEILPTFNSFVIEYYLYQIPDLAEHFLYANDDMFFNAPLSPDFFFDKDGYPKVRLQRKVLGKFYHQFKSLVTKNLGQYRTAVVEAMNLVNEKFGKYYSGLPHHNVDAYKKSDYRDAVEAVFKEQTERTKFNRIRAYGDISRSAFSLYAMAVGHGHLKYANRNESSRFLVHKHDFGIYLNRYRPKLFCLNDTQHAGEHDRKKIRPFLENLFPVKSAFEK